MDELEKRLRREESSVKIVRREREKLIAEGCYPKQFNFPLAIQFEVTSKCNLKCKHCYNRSGGNRPADFTPPESRPVHHKSHYFIAIIWGNNPS